MSGCGLLAVDCAADHWAAVLGGHREPGGTWRADCPVCHAPRALQWDVPGRAVRWKTWCGERDVVRPILAARLGGCMPKRGGRVTVDPDDLIALALAPMAPASLRLAMLELAGIGTADALDKLGIRREHRARTISGRTADAPKLVQNRRSRPVRNAETRTNSGDPPRTNFGAEPQVERPLIPLDSPGYAHPPGRRHNGGAARSAEVHPAGAAPEGHQDQSIAPSIALCIAGCGRPARRSCATCWECALLGLDPSNPCRAAAR